MADQEFSSCRPEQTAERWPLILWSVGGTIVAAIVLWLDKNPLVAAACLVIGIAVGCAVPFLIERVVFPLMDGYQRFWDERLSQNRSWDLLFDVMDSAEFQRRLAAGSTQQEMESQSEMALSRSPHSEQFKRLIDEEAFGAMLGLPVLLGMVHGSVLGGIVGALCPLDPDVQLPAWQGAALGAVLGPIALSFLAAIVIAIMPMPKEVSSLTLSQRALMIVSPFLIIPIAWRCLTRVFHPALIVLVAVHLVLCCLPFFYSWIPPNVRYMPIIWLIGSITVAQTMLLGFWMGMGTSPWRRRLLGTFLGCAYLGLPGLIQGAHLYSLTTYGAFVFMLGGVFLALRRWLVLQQVQTNEISIPAPHRIQFSVFHLLLLTSLAAVIFGLVRSARLASTDSVWFTTVMWVLMLSTLVINALCSTTATLAVHNFPAKLTANFLVSFLLGVAISLTMNRTTAGAPPLPWWISLGGIYLSMCLTLVIVASLLVVRSCGYRLIPRSLPAAL